MLFTNRIDFYKPSPGVIITLNTPEVLITLNTPGAIITLNTNEVIIAVSNFTACDQSN
jgi:hypothetical protein